MYTMLWVPGVLLVVLLALWFLLLKKKVPALYLVIGVVLLLGAIGVVLSNKEVSIEEPRYGIAIIFSIAGLLVPLIVWIKRNDQIK
jgi:hypothetical protein